MTCKGARSGPVACQRRHALLACFYSATLAWNYSAVDRCALITGNRDIGGLRSPHSEGLRSKSRKIPPEVLLADLKPIMALENGVRLGNVG